MMWCREEYFSQASVKGSVAEDGIENPRSNMAEEIRNLGNFGLAFVPGSVAKVDVGSYK